MSSTRDIRALSARPERRPIDIAPGTLPSAQQAVPVPLGRGTFKLGVTWITPTYHPFTRPTPKNGASKK